MKITFNINYHTNWGEALYICGTIPQLGGSDDRLAREMRLGSPDAWSFELDLENSIDEFDYWYIVKAPDKPWRYEWGKSHRFKKPVDALTVKLFDAWKEEPDDKPYYSTAFVNGILNRRFRDQPLKQTSDTLLLRVEAPMVSPDESLAIAGEIELLGKWDPAKALLLNDSHFPVWEISLPLSSVDKPFQYKFLKIRKKDHLPVEWESCDNRLIGFINEAPGSQIVVDGLKYVSKKCDWKGAGTAIPVFSIRTEDDFGVGDFLDIKKMVDWCVKTGQQVLQILPVNDTTKTGTWTDSYPYSANSTFALHPMYLRPEAIGILANVERREHYRKIAKELNALPQIDYEAVNGKKNEYFHEIFDQKGENDLQSDEFKRFLYQNKEWLIPYAAWKVLNELNKTPDNSKWGDYSIYEKSTINLFCKENKNRIDFELFLQFHLNKQLRSARDYAHMHGVILKGDIPIGIGRFSVDAWQHPELFNMDCQAGAPPDNFSIMGQNWGFPTYNWDEMAKDGFKWWKARFRKMAEYFDAYRIDHILGFFRIWQIPLEEVHGLLGYFNPALPFSPEELRRNYDFWINPEIHTQPLILEWMLKDFFGSDVIEVKETYLEQCSDGRYTLRPFINNQRKAETYFEKLEKSEKNSRIRNAIMGLIDDVLFIEDPYNKGHYHPRISAQYTYQYRVLSNYEKWSFDRLYNDFFYHRHNGFWYEKAMWKLPTLVDSTGMLACAEDLGMIPACVPEVLKKLEILSLEIQRMPKDSQYKFGDPMTYPYFSVCTTSTHDMGGIRLWWESDPEATQKFYNDVLHEPGKAPYYAEPWICERIIDQHLKSPSMFCILPLADWLSVDGDLRRNNPADEQINIPANPEHYWRYRMHLTVERLLNANMFNERMKRAIKSSQR